MMMTPQQLAKAAEEAATIKAAEEAEAKMTDEEKAQMAKMAEENAKKAAEDLKKAEWLALPAKRALIDLGAAFSYSSTWSDGKWTDPKLDGALGWHSSELDKDWLEVDIPGDDLYQVSKLSWQKRGHGHPMQYELQYAK